VVPPSISKGSRGWWVSTKTGVWNGGLSPHQPFQGGSSRQGPGPPPNMLRPITVGAGHESVQRHRQLEPERAHLDNPSTTLRTSAQSSSGTQAVAEVA
jgi:hypothetical protein